ncbi:uncharacterized protein IWZ02DRAFT_75858 [Phyllosticta citriasiana]|uniref:uncharacterized protein n=1 Tax=Phyllosticta citriasiana TaxID=595635 RepID=UPI0030FD8338
MRLFVKGVLLSLVMLALIFFQHNCSTASEVGKTGIWWTLADSQPAGVGTVMRGIAQSTRLRSVRQKDDTSCSNGKMTGEREVRRLFDWYVITASPLSLCSTNRADCWSSSSTPSSHSSFQRSRQIYTPNPAPVPKRLEMKENREASPGALPEALMQCQVNVFRPPLSTLAS